MPAQYLIRLTGNLALSSLLALVLVLSGCCQGCYDVDSVIPNPLYPNQTPAKPSCLWVPKQFCPMSPCSDPDEESNSTVNDRNRKLEIADLIDIALLNNPTTKETWANARAAAYFVGMAESALYPDVEVQEILTYQDVILDDPPVVTATPTTAQTNPINPLSNVSASSSFLRQNGHLLRQIARQTVTGTEGTGIGPNTILNSNLAISYLLLDFGGREASIESAKQALYVSDWEHNRQIQTVIISVLQNYYNYSGIIDLLRARESDLANAKANLEAAEQLFEAGIRTKLDVLQAQSDLVNIELNIVDLQGQAQITLGTLITNMGLPANTQINVASFPEDAPLGQISQNIEQLIEVAKNHRPDLFAAYANHEQRRADVTVARSAGLPTLSTDINLESNVYFHNPSLNTRSFASSLVLNIPLFNGFYYVNQTKRAQEFLRASCADIKARELGVMLDVLTSYYNFKTAVESLKFSEDYLRYSVEAYEAALLTYRVGIATILDLLSAQRTLANAKAQKVQARTQWIISLANIAFATGILGENHPCH